jgi:Tol biopolymer transport system component
MSRTGWAIVAALSIAMLAAGFLVGRSRSTPTAVDRIQFSIAPPENATFATPPGGGTGLAAQAAVSPDGRQIVFVASDHNGYQLWLKPFAGDIARPIPGTANATFPFWSPDARYIAFFAAGKLRKVDVTGGPPVTLCDAALGRGGTWNRDNVIVFSPGNSGLMRVTGAGGVPVDVTTLDPPTSDRSQGTGANSHRWPYFLPDGRHFVYTASTGACCPPVKPATIRVASLDRTEAGVTLFQTESSVTYAAGHLLFSREGTLMAQRFDAASLRLTGDAFPIAEQVAAEGSRYTSVSTSSTGVLVYTRGVARPTTRLTWMDRAGRQLGTVGDPDMYAGFVLSPDERRIAVDISSGTPENRDIWILDAGRGTSKRLTFDPGPDYSPVWAPDSSRLVFQGNRAGSAMLREQGVSGATNEEMFLASPRAMWPSDWSSDGRYIAFTSAGNAGANEVWALPLFGDRKPFAVIETPSNGSNGVFSPNGRWIAYQANENGRPQIRVQTFPPTAGPLEVSKTGGIQPMWRQDGKELFFLSPESRMMAAAVDTGGQFESGTPIPLFTVATIPVSIARQYAVSKDGRRFLVNTIQQQSTTTPLTVVMNWLKN